MIRNNLKRSFTSEVKQMSKLLASFDFSDDVASQPEHALEGVVIIGGTLRLMQPGEAFSRQAVAWLIKFTWPNVKHMARMLVKELDQAVIPSLNANKRALNEVDYADLEKTSLLITRCGDFLLAAEHWFRWRNKVQNEREMDGCVGAIKPLADKVISVHAKLEALQKLAKRLSKTKQNKSSSSKMVSKRKSHKAKRKLSVNKELPASSVDDSRT